MADKKMKILVIGSGGREHAIVWKLKKSKKIEKIYCAPGNAGTASLSQNVPIDSSNIKELLNFAKAKGIDLTFVGPEGPLINGIVDLFKKNNQVIVGPAKKAARLEGSKVFSKMLMKKYGIPTANFKVFTGYKEALLYAQSQKYPLVVKADGQCLGKGVVVAKNFNQAKAFIHKLLIDKFIAQ